MGNNRVEDDCSLKGMRNQNVDKLVHGSHRTLESFSQLKTNHKLKELDDCKVV